jgi:hypothetical protein
MVSKDIDLGEAIIRDGVGTVTDNGKRLRIVGFPVDLGYITGG